MAWDRQTEGRIAALLTVYFRCRRIKPTLSGRLACTMKQCCIDTGATTHATCSFSRSVLTTVTCRSHTSAAGPARYQTEVQHSSHQSRQTTTHGNQQTHELASIPVASIQPHPCSRRLLATDPASGIHKPQQQARRSRTAEAECYHISVVLTHK